MEEQIYRQIPRIRALERWENEGGRINAEPRVKVGSAIPESIEFFDSSHSIHRANDIKENI